MTDILLPSLEDVRATSGLMGMELNFVREKPSNVVEIVSGDASISYDVSGAYLSAGDTEGDSAALSGAAYARGGDAKYIFEASFIARGSIENRHIIGFCGGTGREDRLRGAWLEVGEGRVGTGDTDSDTDIYEDVSDAISSLPQMSRLRIVWDGPNDKVHFKIRNGSDKIEVELPIVDSIWPRWADGNETNTDATHGVVAISESRGADETFMVSNVNTAMVFNE